MVRVYLATERTAVPMYRQREREGERRYRVNGSQRNAVIYCTPRGSWWCAYYGRNVPVKLTKHSEADS